MCNAVPHRQATGDPTHHPLFATDSRDCRTRITNTTERNERQKATRGRGERVLGPLSIDARPLANCVMFPRVLPVCRQSSVAALRAARIILLIIIHPRLPRNHGTAQRNYMRPPLSECCLSGPPGSHALPVSTMPIGSNCEAWSGCLSGVRGNSPWVMVADRSKMSASGRWPLVRPVTLTSRTLPRCLQHATYRCSLLYSAPLSAMLC